MPQPLPSPAPERTDRAGDDQHLANSSQHQDAEADHRFVMAGISRLPTAVVSGARRVPLPPASMMPLRVISVVSPASDIYQYGDLACA